jgi:putative flippase GtrA
MSASTTDRVDVFWQLLRYIANGVAATLVHYAVLRTGLEVLRLPSAGLANLLGAVFGIAVSFAGSRWFVFRSFDEPLMPQAMKFVGLYAAIACMHAILLFAWTDLWRLDYRIGFMLAIVVQVIGSYVGNRFLVFNR